MTDMTFGFDTALGIATEAVDRLHSTAHSHHRIVVVEIHGTSRWLARRSARASPAAPTSSSFPKSPTTSNPSRTPSARVLRGGKSFSIVAVAEGALSKKDASIYQAALDKKEKADAKEDKKKAKAAIAELEIHHAGNTLRLARQLEELTHLESRVTILGYVQRGGAPSAVDRLLATRLGTACADLINKGTYGVMVASRGDGTEPVPLEKTAGKRKTVPLNHPWILSARHVGTSLGD